MTDFIDKLGEIPLRQQPGTQWHYSVSVDFGLNFAIIEDPVEAESYSPGEYYWGGAAGTWFWIDPVENLVFIGMIQQFGDGRPDVRGISRQLVYQAIMQPYGIQRTGD